MSQGCEEKFGQLYDSAKKVTRRERDVEQFHTENSELYGLSSNIQTRILPDLRSDYHPEELFKEPVKELAEQVAEICEYEEGYEEKVENEVEVERPWPLSNYTELEEELVENPAEIKIPGSELVEFMVQPIQEELAESEAQNLESGTLIAYGHLVREAIVDGIDQAVDERSNESDSVRYNFQFKGGSRTREGYLLREVGEVFERDLVRTLKSGITYREESRLLADTLKSKSRLFFD